MRRLILFLVLAAASHAQPPPDLTAPGVISGIDRSAPYNLGPTGLRGWIYVNTAQDNGATSRLTDDSRQILVTAASTPGNSVLAVDDVIPLALAILRAWQKDEPGMVIDFTRYDLPAREPADPTANNPTRNWSLINRINQKHRRPQDAPVALKDLTDEEQALIRRRCPGLF